MSTILLDNQPAIEPARLYADCIRQRWPTEWFGKPNSWENIRGVLSGQGWILLSRTSLDALDLNAEHDLTFSIAPQEVAGLPLKKPQTVTAGKLHVVSATCIVSGLRGDPDCAYLLELADRRRLARGALIDSAYNVLNADGSDYLSATINADTTDAWTWEEMTADVWGGLEPWLGNYPGLPFEPDGTPEGFDFYGNNPALDALGFILDRLGCALTMDADGETFAIVQVGADDEDAVNALAAADGLRIWDDDPQTPTVGRAPEKVRVQFPVQLATVDTTGASPWYTIDLPDATPLPGVQKGTLAVVNDDLAAVYDAGDNLTNSAALTSRAAERAAAYFAALHAASLRRVYGLPLGDEGLLPGSLIASTRWGDRGRGMVTEVTAEPAAAPSPQVEQASSGTGSTVRRFVVLQVFADYLKCTPFTPPGSGVQEYDPTLDSGATDIVYVAKPYELQQSPWDGKTATLNGQSVTFSFPSFSGWSKRTATGTVSGTDITENQVVVPDYVAGDIIEATPATTGLTDPLSSPVAWEDMNEAGRAWAVQTAAVTAVTVGSTAITGGTNGDLLGVSGGVLSQYDAVGGASY